MKPYLDQTLMILIEFKDLKIEAEDWLYDRYSEIRKLSKAWLKTQTS